MSTKKKVQDSGEKLNELIKIFLEKNHTLGENSYPELEVKFGTKHIKQISKINFNNVVKSLLNFGFVCKNKEDCWKKMT